ncbi:MAG: DNA polymerase III subunit delta [Candidatus Cloacimonetes bacterium]|nr:DNA polymerase III subunit delta [Candidatus Cloacimonadota bacterium]
MPKPQSIPHYEFLKNFPEQKPQSVYYIFGPENYLKDIVLKEISGRFKSSGSEDFDFIILHADTDSATNALEQLEMMPFMAKFRLVILKNFDTMKASDKLLIAEYIQNPVPTSILVLTAAKIDERAKANKMISEKAMKIICRSPYSTVDILKWLNVETKEKKIFMDNDSKELFTRSIELDYQLAANELEKLIIYTKGKGSITIEDVRETVGKSRTNKVFDLQNEIGKRNLEKSLTILENMIANNESAVFVIIMLSTFFRTLWRVKALQRSNLSNSEIENRYLPEIFYKFRKDYVNYAKNYSKKAIQEIFSLLLQADIDAKSLNLKDEIILEILVYKICKS